MSLPKVITIAKTFTMSILCVPLKPNTCTVPFPEMIMIVNVFTSQKHQISKKKVFGFNLKAKLEIDATRQANIVSDSYMSVCLGPNLGPPIAGLPVRARSYFPKNFASLPIWAPAGFYVAPSTYNDVATVNLTIWQPESCRPTRRNEF